jgi:periplasmic divalent cation tolerance protein
MPKFIQVSTTVETQEQAERMAREIVEARVAACAQIDGPILSVYWWEGRMETEPEWRCVFKTRQESFGALEQAIRARHPYEVPEIVATPITAGSRDYLAWITDETR